MENKILGLDDNNPDAKDKVHQNNVYPVPSKGRRKTLSLYCLEMFLIPDCSSKNKLAFFAQFCASD